MEQDVATPAQEEDEGGHRRGIVSFFKELPVLVALALGIALLIKAFLVQAFFIPSASMEPTLRIGDRVLVNKLSYRFGEPDRGDIVVFRDPYGDPCAGRAEGAPVPAECDRNILEATWGWFAELFGLPTGETRDFIKRVVGLPGETIEIHDGDVYVCDTPCDPVNEKGKPKDGEKVTFESSADEGPQRDHSSLEATEVPDGHYYVLGDNRANSSDSRAFKAISKDKIVGRAFVVVWPPTRFDGL